ncbi:transcriptional regulator [Enterobacter ludwigii]|nr:transcriptional regulator [Enterobacter ludwigii]RTN63132.1 transcriptional regulator [Enterobacter ludwigii]
MNGVINIANTNVLLMLLKGLNSFLTNVIALETKKIIILVL